MSDSSETADQLFARVLVSDEYDARLRKSLQRIKAACDDIEKSALAHAKNGVKFSKSPISPTAVGNKCVELFGGPTADSIIRNRKNEPLKPLYVTLRSQELKLPMLGSEPDPLSKVMPQNLRAYVSSLEQKITLLEQFNAGLTLSLKRISPVSMEALLADQPNESAVNADDAIANPSKVGLQKAVAKLLDPTHLRKFGFKLDRGYIVDGVSGDEFLDSDEVAHLKSAAFLQ